MGDPRKLRAKYQGPNHPWEATRMEEESKLFRDYGLSNKKEIWRLRSLLAHYKSQAKELTASQNENAPEEAKLLLKKLQKYGLLQEGAILDDVLSLTLPEIMDRRLQTVVFKKQLARTVKQARQFIVHDHILIEGKPINSPGMLVTLTQEKELTFAARSPLVDEMHPERKQEVAETPEEAEVLEKKEAKKEEKKEVKKEKPAKEVKKETTVKEVKKEEEKKEVKKDEKKDAHEETPAEVMEEAPEDPEEAKA